MRLSSRLFFGRCDKEPKEAAKNGVANGDATKEKEAETSDAVVAPSEDELGRLFASLDEAKDGSLSKEQFIALIRVFMKIAKETVITSDISIKESKTLRRLELGEVVEVLNGPVREETVDVMRVRAKCMKDDVEGYITMSGNQGTMFLEEGGNCFKVIQATILTPEFELDAGEVKTTRKLKQGEIVEVREWAKKEEKSGLMRMKCKAKSSGAIGWVTTVGNQGNVYLEGM